MAKTKYLKIGNVIEAELRNIRERGHPHLFPRDMLCSEEDLLTDDGILDSRVHIVTYLKEE